jgi:hypothetical protein
VTGAPVGALNLCAGAPHSFTDLDQHLAALLAGQADVAVTAALRHYDVTTLTDHLRIALSSCSVIDQAMGIIIARHGCPAVEAFAILRGSSQRRNITLRTLAEDLVAAAGYGAGPSSCGASAGSALRVPAHDGGQGLRDTLVPGGGPAGQARRQTPTAVSSCAFDMRERPVTPRAVVRLGRQRDPVARRIQARRFRCPTTGTRSRRPRPIWSATCVQRPGQTPGDAGALIGSGCLGRLRAATRPART